MKLQFGATCFISLYKRDEKSRKFKQEFTKRKVRGCVLVGEPRSLTVGNGKNPDILVYLEPFQTYDFQVNKDVAYIEVHGAFLADV